MITNADIPIINQALASGHDVRIQLTPDGYRIVSEKIRVLKRIGKPSAQQKYGFSDKRE